MPNSAQLEVKLVFNNEAVKEQIGDVASDVSELGDAGHKAGEAMGEGIGHGAKEGAKEIGKMLAEFFLIKEAFELVKELSIGAVEAFEDDERAVKSLAGSFLQLDQNGNSLEQLNSMAEEFKDSFEGMGAATGVSSDKIQNAFQDIADRGMMSVEAAKAFTEEMAYASRAVPGGIEEISSGIEAIQTGMVKAKNPVVGMISSMGLIKGNAKEVAKEMSKMGIEAQMELVEKAVKKMSEKMKDAPMTLGQQVSAFGEASQKVMEAIGGPIAESLGNAVGNIKKMFFTPTGENTKLLNMIIGAATTFGSIVGSIFELMGPAIDGFMDSIGSFSDEISSMWGFMDGSGVTMEAMIGYAKLVGEVLGFAVAGLATGLGLAANLFVMTIKEMINFVAKAVEGIGTVMSHIPGLKGAGAATYNAGQAIGDFGNSGQKKGILDQVRSADGKSKSGLAQELMDSVSSSGGDVDKAAAEYREAMKQRIEMEKVVSQAGTAAQLVQADDFVAAYNVAAEAHDQGAQENILKFIAANDQIADALMFTAPDKIAGGKDAFLKNLTKVGGAKDAEFLKQAWKPDLAFKKSPDNHFNGGQVFNIKQDFKDQDPDRVAVVFRQDIAKAATSRAQATTSMAGAF